MVAVSYLVTHQSSVILSQYAAAPVIIPPPVFCCTVAVTTYLKSGPLDPQSKLTCLLTAEARVLNLLTMLVPRDDSFLTDGWAPVIDGVDLIGPIMDSIERGDIAEGVDLLMGTNLDEGTEFMDLTPALSCSADSAQLQEWAVSFYGERVGPHVPFLFSVLQPPLPACGVGGKPEDVPGDAARNYNVAMRSAGDVAIRCPLRRLAQRVSGKAFVYEFSVVPTSSLNAGNTSVLGSFHGAEVPFVFGDSFELSTDHERDISAAMGCYWRNFACNGDPSIGLDCPARWLPYVKRTPYHLNFGEHVSLGKDFKVHDSRCELFRGRPSWRPRRGRLWRQGSNDLFMLRMKGLLEDLEMPLESAPDADFVPEPITAAATSSIVV